MLVEGFLHQYKTHLRWKTYVFSIQVLQFEGLHFVCHLVPDLHCTLPRNTSCLFGGSLVKQIGAHTVLLILKVLLDACPNSQNSVSARSLPLTLDRFSKPLAFE